MGHNLSYLHVYVCTQTSILTKSHPHKLSNVYTVSLCPLLPLPCYFLSYSLCWYPGGGYALHPLHLGKQHTLISGIWLLELRQVFPCSCHNLCDPVNSSPGKLGSPVRMMQELSLGSSEARDVILCILIRRPERILSEEAATRWEFRGRYDQLLAT